MSEREGGREGGGGREREREGERTHGMLCNFTALRKCWSFLPPPPVATATAPGLAGRGEGSGGGRGWGSPSRLFSWT